MLSRLRHSLSAISWFIKPGPILLFTSCFTIAYFWLAHEGFYLNDDFSNARLAADLLHNRFAFQDLPAYHRLMVFGPVALLLSVFGISIYSLTLWPLLGTLGCLALIYFFFRPEDKLVTTFGLLLLGLNFHTLFLNGYLFPDNIFMFFAFAAAGSLYAARRNGQNPIGWALFFVLANFAALLAKETIIWYLPFYIWVAATDFLTKKHSIFWASAVGFGALVLGAYLGIYKWQFGSFFYRFTMVENTHLLMAQSENYRDLNLPKRLWEAPLRFFIGTGIFLLPAFCFRFFRRGLSQKTLRLHSGESFWTILGLSTLLFFWFGTTSISDYRPITLVPRMATPLFPPLCLAAAYQLRHYFRYRTGALWLAIPLLAAAVFARSEMSIVYGLPAAYFLYEWWQQKQQKDRLPASVFILMLALALLLRPVHFMRKPSVSGFFEQEAIVKALLKTTPPGAALFTDGWFQKSAAYYFSFASAAPVKVLNYETSDTVNLGSYPKAFLLVNKSTLTNPDLQFKHPEPGFTISEAEIYRRFPNRKLVAEKGPVKLYQIFN